MNEPVNIYLLIAGVGGMAVSLLSIIVMLSIAFPKLREVEDRIAGPERSILSLRNIWGNGPIGRLMRTSYVFAFLLIRNIPLAHFQKAAGKIGNPTALLPLGLRFWALLPSITMYLGGAVMLISTQYL
ncbi:MAG: hypothetical protein CL581_08980 [Alteromonadaceae bacterium]|nr:hypothetical protein [Alteromonadaceae bacterium]MBH87126.1 hypothetical protein [Alteromonadaceae bacterium]|tara:strand:+ start:2642 stop:3025 length:384 start_codon:yes stop_codon:yes gene_type:complete